MDWNRQLRDVVQHGSFEQISELIRLGADVSHTDIKGRTALFEASEQGNVEAINALLKAGANVSHTDVMGKTALFEASKRGNVEAITALSNAGANIDHADTLNKTALFYASIMGQVQAIAALLDAGADVHHADELGATALFHASARRQVQAIIALSNAGADVNQVDPVGETALFHASAEGHAVAIKALLKVGANINHVNLNGQTALFHASKEGKVEAITALLYAGADVNHLDNNGQTALSQYLGENDRVRKVFRNYNAFAVESSISISDYIIRIVNTNTDLGRRDPYNLSLDTYSDDLQMGMFFRYGRDTVVSISFDSMRRPHVSHLQAKAPICTGDGRVIYTKKTGDRHLVYENNMDLRDDTEIELCHSLSSSYEKNWGCFGRKSEEGRPGDYFIVYSVIPLRIFKVENYTQCAELPSVRLGYAYENPRENIVVKKEYPNFERIERMYRDERDRRGTGIFRGGTRGIKFGDEYLFVGHVTLHKANEACFPNWFMSRNATNSRSGRMYFMYFFTVRLANGMFKLSRVSSCFQPPSLGSFHKITFPCGIAYAGNDEEEVVVSFGRDDSDCLMTTYATTKVNTMLAPVGFWSRDNYVFHPNYASSLRTESSPDRTLWKTLLPTERVGLAGTSPDSDGHFNPAITNAHGASGNMFITAWRKMNGSVETWRGYNQVVMETCSLKIKRGRLRYTRESDQIQFQVGETTVGGEDPRLITENNCPLLMVNDFDIIGNRRMYVHNLKTDNSAMVVHPFCHNISGKFEKNWGPFYADEKLFFVYSVVPLIVGKVTDEFQCPSPSPMSIECERVSRYDLPDNMQTIFQANGLNMRGGTPGLKYANNEYLFVGHAVQHDEKCFPDFTVQRFVSRSDDPLWRKKYPKLYTAFFFTIAKDYDKRIWRLKQISCCSQLPEKRENFGKIHFPAGLAKANLGEEFKDCFIVSFGEKDEFGGFCAVNRKFVEYVLRPVEQWNVHNYVVDVNYFQNIAQIDPDFT